MLFSGRQDICWWISQHCRKRLVWKIWWQRGLSDNLLLLCLLSKYQGSRSIRKIGDISKQSAPPPLIFWSAADTFSSVNCYQKTFRKVGNKAIYLEACHTVVHVEGGVLKIHIQLLFSHHQPLFRDANVICFTPMKMWAHEPIHYFYAHKWMSLLV